MTQPRYHLSRSCPRLTPQQRLRIRLDEAEINDARITSLPQYPTDAPGPRFRVDIPPRIWKPHLRWMDDNEFFSDYLGEVIGSGWMLSSYISDGFQPEDGWYSFAAIWIRA